MLTGGASPLDCPMWLTWSPIVGVWKTGCPGGIHPVAAEVDTVEDHDVAIGSPNRTFPLNADYQLVRLPGEVLLKSTL